MRKIPEDIRPLSGNNLFVTHYWPDKQSDPPLHFHEDYMLCLTLGVRGKRILNDAVEDFTENDLILISPGAPHCFKRDRECGDRRCETAVVMFNRDMPSWKLLAMVEMEPIRRMLLRPAAGLQFSEQLAGRVRDRLLELPRYEGLEAVMRFFDILNELATADPGEIKPIGARTGDPSFDEDDRVRKIVLFVERNFHRKLSLNEIGAEVGMSPTSVCRYFKRRTHNNLWDYLSSYRINRAARLIAETNKPISEIGPCCGFNNISNFNHAFRERVGTNPSDYRRKMRESHLPAQNGLPVKSGGGGNFDAIASYVRRVIGRRTE